MHSSKALILGGTGFVGRHVCEKLHRQGWALTLPTRHVSHATAVQHLPRLTAMEVDLHAPGALEQLLPGHDAVVNLVAVLHGNEARFEKTHVQLVGKIAAACAASGVRRLIHISALGAAEDSPSMYQRSKARGEALLRAAGLDLTVLRPSVIFGHGDRFLNLFAQLQRLFPVMPLACASARFQPVWVEDVAHAVLHCLEDSTTINQIYECAGPEVLTLAELVRLAGRFGSQERPVIPLPMGLGRLQALMMELAPGEPLMSRDNLDAMQVDNIASGACLGLAALGIVPASVSAVAPAYLGQRNARSHLLNLREGKRHR